MVQTAAMLLAPAIVADPAPASPAAEMADLAAIS
jgi:hypothetical protein